MQQAIELRTGASNSATHCDRHSLRRRVEMWKDPNQQIAIDIGERHADDLLQIEEFGGVGAGLNDAMIGFADNQQGAVGLNRARKMKFLLVRSSKDRLFRTLG